jgi:hypothetical protein
VTLANDSEYVLWVYTFTARGPYFELPQSVDRERRERGSSCLM